MIKSMLKNNKGFAWNVFTIATILLLALVFIFLLFLAHVQTSLYNLKDKVKLELNNTSASATEMIYKDLAEQNFASYIQSFQKHESSIRNDFMKRLKKEMYFNTSAYEMDPDTISLTFETKDGYVNHIFECQVKIKLDILGANRPLLTQKVNITAKHYYKGIESRDEFGDYVYTPSEKNEHNLGGIP